MDLPFGSFLFPLSFPLPPSVLNISSYFILWPAINLKLFPRCLQRCITVSDIRMHVGCQTYTHVAGRKEKQMNSFAAMLHTCQPTRPPICGNMFVPSSMFVDRFVQSHVP